MADGLWERVVKFFGCHLVTKGEFFRQLQFLDLNRDCFVLVLHLILLIEHSFFKKKQKQKQETKSKKKKKNTTK